jgi:hypothetical protein
MQMFVILGPVLKKGLSSQSIKIHLYKTVIRSIVICGGEAWTLTSKMEKC